MANFLNVPWAEMPEAVEKLMTLYQFEVNNHEDERQKVATYLNDAVTQTLSALYIQLSLWRTAPEAQIRREITNAMPLLVDLMSGLNNLARELRPLELDLLGLHDTIILMAELFTIPGQLTITYDGTPTPELPKEVSTAFFRLVQEVIICLQKQGAAEVLLHLRTEGDGVRLIIRDNGKITPDFVQEHSLFGLKVRFKQLNGRLTVDTQSNEGTTITAVWPRSEAASQNPPGRDPVQDEPS